MYVEILSWTRNGEPWRRDRRFNTNVLKLQSALPLGFNYLIKNLGASTKMSVCHRCWSKLDSIRKMDSLVGGDFTFATTFEGGTLSIYFSSSFSFYFYFSFSFSFYFSLSLYFSIALSGDGALFFCSESALVQSPIF